MASKMIEKITKTETLNTLMHTLTYYLLLLILDFYNMPSMALFVFLLSKILSSLAKRALFSQKGSLRLAEQEFNLNDFLFCSYAVLCTPAAVMLTYPVAAIFFHIASKGLVGALNQGRRGYTFFLPILTILSVLISNPTVKTIIALILIFVSVYFEDLIKTRIMKSSDDSYFQNIIILNLVLFFVALIEILMTRGKVTFRFPFLLVIALIVSTSISTLTTVEGLRNIFLFFSVYDVDHTIIQILVAVLITLANSEKSKTVTLIFGGNIFFFLLSCIFTYYTLKNETSEEQNLLLADYENLLLPSSISKKYTLSFHLRGFKNHIIENRKSRRIFYFFSINLCFMFVQFFYGFFTNSLGLISDSCHMLFDCIAMAIGLLSAYASEMEVDAEHTFGYCRYKVLSGFINSIFLVFIAGSITTEAMHRIFEPPQIETKMLLPTSIAGLVVNLVGVCFFLDTHDHSHGSSDSHCGSHSHGSTHNHEDMNLRGLFLHVLADTLGSVGVIISSLLVKHFKLFISDPICSMAIAIFILVAGWPLTVTSGSVLLQKTPAPTVLHLESALNAVLELPGVLAYRKPRFWELVPGRVIGSLCVLVEESGTDLLKGCNSASEAMGGSEVPKKEKIFNESQPSVKFDAPKRPVSLTKKIKSLFSDLKGLCPKDLTVQLETETFSAKKAVPKEEYVYRRIEEAKV